jgi:UDP-N-acetylglucosamine 3-dehydrogenase
MALEGNGRVPTRLAVGLIGLGEVGQHHLAGYESTQRARLVAVADLNDDLTAAAAQRTGARAYSDYQDLLSCPGLEAVDVSLPHHLHLPVVLEALERGLNVLVEKPMGLTVDECNRMLAAAEAAGRTLSVSHNQVFFAPHVKAIELLNGGSIGRAKLARLRLGVGGRYPGWRREPDKAGGGLLFDAGVHRFYMLRAILGDPIGVIAMTDVADPGRESEGAGIMVFDFADGGFGVIDANYDNPPGTFDDRIEIAGDAGLIALAGCEAEFEGFTTDPPLRIWHDGTWRTVDSGGMNWSGSVQAAVHDFVDSVLDQRRPRVAGEDGRMVVAMIQATYLSARLGRRVAISEVLGSVDRSVEVSG